MKLYSRTRVRHAVTMPVWPRILGHRAEPPAIANGGFRPRLLPNPATPEDAPMSRSQFSRLSLCAAAIGALAIAAFAVAPSRAAEDAVIIPAPAADVQGADGVQTAVLAGGCFRRVPGVMQ